MKRKSCLLSGVFSAALLFSPVEQAVAQTNAKPPTQLTYQGFLTDANGSPFGNTAPVNKTIIFRIYDALTGGTLKWSSQQVITVDKGYFSALLGQGSAVGTEPFNADLTGVFTGTGASDRYLELTADGTVIAPRLRFLPAPYAMLAKSATELLDPSNGSGSLSINNGKIGIGQANPGHPLSFADALGDKISLYGQGSTSYGFGIQGNLLQIHSENLNSDVAFGYGSSASMTETMRIKGNGFVGIGTKTPGGKLEIVGQLDSTPLLTLKKTSASWSTGTIFNNFRFLSTQSEAADGPFRQFNVGAGGVSIGYSTVPTYGSSDALYVSGNVGVGTAAPTAKLEVSGEVKATTFTGNGTIPLGGIIMWSGSATAVPAGWALCNGQTVSGRTTPNLQDRFVIGAGSSYAVGATGGSTTASLNTANLPSFNISYWDIFVSENNNVWSYDGKAIASLPLNAGINGNDRDNVGYQMSRTATYNGSATPFSVMPPYYALAFIMRVQ